MRLACILGLAIAPVTVSRQAVAANSGVFYGPTVDGGFQMLVVTQNPGVTWTFTTSNLSAGADTVIHVQNNDDPQWAYIAGNDDYNGTLASQVVVSPIGTTRNLRVIVRRYSQYSPGTCDLTGTPSSGTGIFYSQIPLGGDIYTMSGPLALGAHVTTAEVQGGASDTVMLVFDALSPGHAIAGDDDDGVGFMSWIHLPEACPNGCWAVLANFNRDITGATTNLFWDDDADTTDYDSDGLGATLESIICLNQSTCLDSHNADTDQDGLSDGAEVYGIESNAIPVKLATWGAGPLQKDLFYEFDWIKCNAISDPNKCPQGSESGQMGSGFTADSDFYTYVFGKFQTDLTIKVHMDIHRASNSPYWVDWGDWGGAERYDSDVGNGCGVNGSSSWRTNLFHHALSYPWEAEACPGCNLGWTCWGPGPFVSVGVNEPRVTAHETGHSFAIDHGARPFTTDVNYKSNYVSIMNYAFQDIAPNFSYGTLPSLNPTSLSESTGLGTGAANINLLNGKTALQQLRDNWCPVTAYTSGNCVNLTTGAIDWNRDGVFAPQGTNVQGPVQIAGFSGEAQTNFWPASGGGHGTLKDSAMAWVTVGSPVGSYLFTFGRNESNVLIWARQTASTLNAGCAGPFTSFVEGTPDCAGMGDASIGGKPGFTAQVPGPLTLTVGPGAAEYDSNKILVVYQRTTGAITAKLLTIDSNGLITYGTSASVPGGWVAQGDITAVNTSSGSTKQVTVWAPVNVNNARKLLQFRYTNGGWESAVVTQRWGEDGSDINPIWGIGATRGYQDNSATLQTYGAIPTNPSGMVEFARQSNGGPFWNRVTFTCSTGSFGCSGGVASSWASIGGVGMPPGGTQPMAAARPGLTYQKTAGQANAFVGRFYMMINQASGGCSGPFGTPAPTTNGCEPRLIMTEGNVATGTPTTKRLTWITPAQSLGAPIVGAGGMSLIDDVSRDINLRGAMTDSSGNGHFMPLADGIMNATMTDMNDFNYITGGSDIHAIAALRASLCLDGGSWPTTSTPFGAVVCPLPAGLP